LIVTTNQKTKKQHVTKNGTDKFTIVLETTDGIPVDLKTQSMENKSASEVVPSVTPTYKNGMPNQSRGHTYRPKQYQHDLCPVCIDCHGNGYHLEEVKCDLQGTPGQHREDRESVTHFEDLQRLHFLHFSLTA